MLSKIAGDNRTEDDIAMLRKEREYKNVLLVEQPNTNFAHTQLGVSFYLMFII